MRRLAHSQKAREDLTSLGGRTFLETMQLHRKMTLDEAKTIQKQMIATDKEQIMIISDIWRRATLESSAELRNWSGWSICRFVEEKYAEPLTRLTPDELQLVRNAFDITVREMRGPRRFRRVASVAASFGFAYWLFRYLSAD